MLENRERVPDSIVFPGRGLTLVKVDFPADELLAEKAAQSMARRMAED